MAYIPTTIKLIVDVKLKAGGNDLHMTVDVLIYSLWDATLQRFLGGA